MLLYTVLVCVHLCVRVCMCMHKHVCQCMLESMHACKHVCEHVICVCTCVSVYGVCACVCARARMRTCIDALNQNVKPFCFSKPHQMRNCLGPHVKPRNIQSVAINCESILFFFS